MRPSQFSGSVPPPGCPRALRNSCSASAKSLLTRRTVASIRVFSMLSSRPLSVPPESLPPLLAALSPDAAPRPVRLLPRTSLKISDTFSAFPLLKWPATRFKSSLLGLAEVIISTYEGILRKASGSSSCFICWNMGISRRSVCFFSSRSRLIRAA